MVETCEKAQIILEEHQGRPCDERAEGRIPLAGAVSWEDEWVLLTQGEQQELDVLHGRENNRRLITPVWQPESEFHPQKNEFHSAWRPALDTFGGQAGQSELWLGVGPKLGNIEWG